LLGSDEINFLKPSLMLMIVIGFIPLYFFNKRQSFKLIDRGFVLIFSGGVILTIASVFDYIGDTGLISPWLMENFGTKEVDGDLGTYVYLPGIIPFALGLMMWLPKAASLVKEVEQRKVVERELRVLAEQLSTEAIKAEMANESKSDFLATMTHELRTPLNAIIGFSQILKNPNSKTSTKQKEEFLDLIESSGNHLLEIINDMLDLSKLEAGKVEVRFESFDLQKVLEASFAVCKNMATQKQIVCVIAPCDVMLETDSKIMKQVFINIMSNAIKFTPIGGEVRVDSFVEDGQCIVKIMDSGIGMNQEDILVALEPFRQVEGHYDRENAGTGLGLPLVQRFMNLLGGSLTIESTKDIGTTIYLSLPVA
jgi:two-component system cell cycle sensor histidine kinase PleC